MWRRGPKVWLCEWARGWTVAELLQTFAKKNKFYKKSN